MWKCLVKTTLLVGVAIGLLALGQPTPKQQNSTDAQQRNGNQVPPPTPTGVTVGVTQASPPVETSKPNDKAQGVWEKAFAPESWPNWGLIVIGIVASCAALKTLGAIQKQADLQGIALRQWVRIENWKGITHWPYNSPNTPRLHIQFDVTNPTNLPLTFAGCFVKFSGRECSVKQKHLIPPKDKHTATMSIAVTEQQAGTFNDPSGTGFGFVVAGCVFFEDVLEKDRTQPFSGFIRCNGGKVTFVQNFGGGLYLADETDNQNPN